MYCDCGWLWGWLVVVEMVWPVPVVTCVPDLAWPMSLAGPGLPDLLGGEVRAAAVSGWQHLRSSGMGG